MSTKPKIRELKPSDMDSFTDLCEARDELNRRQAELRAELVEWMAFHNPHADGKPTYFVVDQGGEVMGHLGRMPTIFQVGATTQRASYIHDLFIHQDLVKAGHGFFLSMRMYRAAEKASDSFCALIWTNEINIRLQKARKYHQMWADRHVKLLRADAQIDKRVPIQALGTAGKPVAAAMLRVADTALASWFGAKRKVVEVDRFDDRFDRFATRMTGRIGVSPLKTQDYLNWKYIDRPQITTAQYASVDGAGELTGFISLAVPDTEFRESYIQEIVADPEDPKTIAALVHQAVKHCRDAGAYTIQSIATDPRFIDVLKKFLFFPRPPKEPLFVANADRYASPALLTEPGNWHFCFGDSEGNL